MCTRQGTAGRSDMSSSESTFSCFSFKDTDYFPVRELI